MVNSNVLAGGLLLVSLLFSGWSSRVLKDMSHASFANVLGNGKIEVSEEAESSASRTVNTTEQENTDTKQAKTFSAYDVQKAANQTSFGFTPLIQQQQQPTKGLHPPTSDFQQPTEAWHVPTFEFQGHIPCLTGHHRKIDCEMYCDLYAKEDEKGACTEACSICDSVDPSQIEGMYWPAIDTNLLGAIANQWNDESTQLVHAYLQRFKGMDVNYPSMQRTLVQRFQSNLEQQGQPKDFSKWSVPNKIDVLDDDQIFSQKDDYLYNPDHRRSIPGLDRVFLWEDWKKHLGLETDRSVEAPFQLVGAGVGPPGSGKSKLFRPSSGKFLEPLSGKTLLPKKDFIKIDLDAERLHFIPFIEATSGALFCQSNMEILRDLGYHTRSFNWIHPTSMRKFEGCQIWIVDKWVYATYPSLAANDGRAHLFIVNSVARRLVLNRRSVIMDVPGANTRLAQWVVIAELQAKRMAALEKKSQSPKSTFSFQIHGVYITNVATHLRRASSRMVLEGRGVADEYLKNIRNQMIEGILPGDGGTIQKDEGIKMVNWIPVTVSQVDALCIEAGLGSFPMWSVSTNDGDRDDPLELVSSDSELLDDRIVVPLSTLQSPGPSEKGLSAKANKSEKVVA